MNAFEQVTMVMTVIERLRSALEREIEALRHMRVDHLQALEQEKNELAEIYEREMLVLRKDPSILGSLDHGIRLKFEDCVRSLQATARRDADAILATKTVIERIVEKLASNSSPQNTAQGYGYAANQQAGQTAGQVIPIAFNQKF